MFHSVDLLTYDLAFLDKFISKRMALMLLLSYKNQNCVKSGCELVKIRNSDPNSAVCTF